MCIRPLGAMLWLLVPFALLGSEYAFEGPDVPDSVGLLPVTDIGRSSVRLVEVVSARLRRHPLDSGCVVLAEVRNISCEPISLTSMVIEGGPEENARPASGDFLWSYLMPPVIPPGSSGELMARLESAPESSLRCSASFSDSEGRSQAVGMEAGPERVRITGAYANRQLDRLYVYVRNDFDLNLQITGMLLNGEDILQQALMPWEAIPLGWTLCVEVPLAEPLAEGQLCTLSLDGSGGVHVFEVFRVSSSLPFGREERILNRKLDPQCILGCPTHAHGTRREAAAKTIKLYREALETRPRSLAFVHTCRASLTDGILIFGRLTDGVRLNPCVPIRYPGGHEKEDGETPYWMTKLAKRTVEPRLVYTLVDPAPLPRPRSLSARIAAYDEIAAGAKGLFYRDADRSDPVIGRLSRELGQLAPSLRVSEPASGLKVEAEAEGEVHARALFVGNDGVLLVVTCWDKARFFHAGECTLAVENPYWLNLSQAFPFSGEGVLEEADAECAGGAVRVRVGDVDGAAAVLLLNDKGLKRFAPRRSVDFSVSGRNIPEHAGPPHSGSPESPRLSPSSGYQTSVSGQLY